jgi:heme-degrading monooxygenase HmoA
MPIQVHVDLTIDSSREAEAVRYFETVFRPAAQKFEGYRDVRMLKLRAVPYGRAPAGLDYRFAITYDSEELRQKWVSSDIHQEVWGAMERMLADPNYTVLLFDVT